MIMEVLKIMRKDMSELRGDVKTIKDDLRAIKLNQDKHTVHIDYLGERVEQLRETTIASLGFSTNLNVQHQRMEKQIAELAKRVAKLEKTK